MSDKSFGDHMSRGAVKNPLLSTAVTGLSIEDLTQNAVLLPVSRSQELFGRQEPIGSQSHTLAHTIPPNIPSGDANFTPINPPQPTPQNAKNIENYPKIEDDFDVNEYFARLQGTRYVSAPINLKEDTSANLEAREENLEEINLNEPEKVFDDTQQSITADIAQNFSQLPTVLPQVASAVFSSFSNMLSMKSREHTPDDARAVDVKPQDYPDAGVPLHGVSEVKEVAPPPKEPPVSGPGNFRITTKKKAYAQIPGLSSGETAQIPTYPPSFNQPFYTPPTNIETAITNIEPNVFANTVDIPNDNKPSIDPAKSTEALTEPQYDTPDFTQSPILPPPPMFSNLAKKDSLTNAGKALLPPSVARRISSNKPTINTQPPIFSNVDYFIPTPVTSDVVLDPISQPTLAQTPPTSSLPSFPAQVPSQSAFIPASSSTPGIPPPTNPPSVDMKAQIPSTLTSILLTENAPPMSTLNPTSSASLPPPPTFASQSAPPIFNPLNQQGTSNIPISSVPLTTASVPKTAQIFNPYAQNITTDIPKETKTIFIPGQDQSTSKTPEMKVPEPPKVGNTNFRMTKRRPQYYSGPIEGVGAISNNVKPTLNPVDSTDFQGAVFTPEVTTAAIAENPVAANSFQGAIFTPTATEKQDNPVVSGYQNANLTTAEPSFVTPNQYEYNKQEFTPFDMNKAEPAYSTNFNIPFDVSGQTTDNYETPKQESGFGIIGSLKSKLSSLDINKIQNSVTTFFDPAYNAAKPEAIESSYGQSQSGIEIFVPNVDSHVQPYDYNSYQSNFTYGQVAIPNPTDYYQHQMHNVYSTESYYSQPNYGTQSYSQATMEHGYSQQYESQIYGQENQEQQSFGQISSGTPFENISSSSVIGAHENVNYESTLASRSVRDLDRNDDKLASQVMNEPQTNVSMNLEETENAPSNVDENGAGEGIAFPQEVDNLKDVMENLNLSTESKSTTDSQFSHVLNRTNIAEITPPFASEGIELKTDKDKLVSTNINQPNFFNVLGNSDGKSEELIQQDNASTASLFSAPLHDLSSMIATQQVSDRASEIDTESENSKKEFDSQASAKLVATPDFSKEDSFEDQISQANDLNICETCREVTKPEEKGVDLTSQLIENITSPVQLLNPVEVPLTETHSLPIGFDALNRSSEISLIAEKTVETLQVQSVSELLDDDDDEVKRDLAIERGRLGWPTDPAFPPAENILDHDYTFKMNTKNGFFGKDNFFFDNKAKTSNEMKDEFYISQDDPLVLQSQMSIPSAPPAEDFDDTKSDETCGLDVQSIEQDASKDFVFEEYVIEPSEDTEDAKDTFTNRVDRFKKLESSEDLTQHKDLVNTMMPSYFDTGNYAVESHFRKSITSPSNKSSEESKPFRIPPGFEDIDREEQTNIIPNKVPDTSTQTRVTETVTFSEVPSYITTTTTAQLRMSPIAYDKPEVKLPDFASVFGSKIAAETFDNVKKTEDKVPDNPTVKTVDEVQEIKVPSLPDPINFFVSTSEETIASESVNRLASYFTCPPKTDSAKSFFELSQGQDHFRQNVKTDIDTKKSFFELGQSQNHYKDANVTQDKFLANLSLMKDLTSCQNLEPSKEVVVRTVNYFTIEYDDIGLNKGEPSIKDREKTDTNVNKLHRIEETLYDDEDLTKMVNDCKYCCDLKAGPILNLREIDFESLGKFSYRQAMDSGGKNCKEGVATQKEGKRDTAVNMRAEDVSPDGNNSEGLAIMTENRMSTEYEYVKHHWFYRVDIDGKSTWRGFSTNDSAAIEKAFHSPDLSESTLVPTDGGRFDVNVMGRLRIAVYWNDKPTNVRRCSWFYKGTTDARYVPYTEPVAEKLEEEYRRGVTTGEWHRRLSLPNNELVVMHGPAVMVHFLQGGSTDIYSPPNLFTFGKKVYRNLPKFKVPSDVPTTVDHLLLLVHGAGEWRSQKEKIQSTMRPRVVRRGFDESEIEDLEPSNIDHLLLLCHGVGSACDMRFRSVEEVVDDFRSTSLQLLQSHYRNSCDAGIVGRVEVLPISWHASLHSGPCGVDRRLARVTLSSIPRLRNFTNDTVLDVLFYTSPHYAQLILNTVCGELNRVYSLFKSRNPDFKGKVSLGGHSLGSVILYDLLCNQEISAPLYPNLSSPQKQYLSGTAAHSPIMTYPQLTFEPLAFYALGSPIAIFECIRGVECLGKEFRLPTCKNFFNIFHPYDPIAYRIEPLINPNLQNVKPSLIPHHKGRKRMHLELKETMARVGADLKQKLVESIKNTWTSMWSSTAPPPDHQLEKVVEEEMEKEQSEEDNPKEEPTQADVITGEMLGSLNGGRRVDYVLQEAPFEMINEYLFAMSSHVCYWESEDTMLLILREIYDSIGVCADVTVPQQSMTVQRTRNDDKVAVNSPDSPSTSYL